ncbi:MAG: heavy metal translocating P-type ATPase, partial [Candidatus Omnitrophica bacterium]|nr:heavy metal translocating P-type ATPase [Candidatus Omnitrophota bacterium]
MKLVKKTEIELEFALPNIPDARDSCVSRLIDLIEAKEGIDAAHLLTADENGPDRICIHFDKEKIGVGAVKEFARRTGMELDKRYGHWLVKADPMHGRQARSAAARLEETEGVLEAFVSANGLVRIEFDCDRTDRSHLRKALRDSGIQIIEEERLGREKTREEEENHEHGEDGHGKIWGIDIELAFALLCGISLLAGWLVSILTDFDPWIGWLFYVAAYFFGGFFTAREAFQKVISKRFEIDFLMLVAALGAATLGEWAEGALLLFLFSLGHSLEHYAMGRARRAIESLSDLTPETAILIRGNDHEEVPAEKLQPGDVILVKSDERIAADGFVIKGESSVNQAAITGESVP